MKLPRNLMISANTGDILIHSRGDLNSRRQNERFVENDTVESDDRSWPVIGLPDSASEILSSAIPAAIQNSTRYRVFA